MVRVICRTRCWSCCVTPWPRRGGRGKVSSSAASPETCSRPRSTRPRRVTGQRAGMWSETWIKNEKVRIKIVLWPKREKVDERKEYPRRERRNVVFSFSPPACFPSDGGAERGAPAELFSRDHVQSAAEPQEILHRLRHRERPAQEGRGLLRGQPGRHSSLRAQEASAHGETQTQLFTVTSPLSAETRGSAIKWSESYFLCIILYYNIHKYCFLNEERKYLPTVHLRPGQLMFL